MSTGPLYLRQISPHCTSHERLQIGPEKRPRPVAVPKGITAAQINEFLRSLPRPKPEDFE